jgi:competence protein ComGC
MAKIITQNKKGLTLVELLIYMSIFSIICLIVTSSVFYLQKIIQNNNQNYYVKNYIYFNLNILQKYLYSSSVKIVDNELKIFDKNDDLILTQKIDNKQIKNIYQNKNFVIDEYLNFEKYEINLIENNRLIKFDISWIDSREKLQNLTEYLVVINRNL